jgi:hypothetical protein
VQHSSGDTSQIELGKPTRTLRADDDQVEFPIRSDAEDLLRRVTFLQAWGRLDTRGGERCYRPVHDLSRSFLAGDTVPLARL